MLRSAFRGKQAADSSTKDENEGRNSQGRSKFFHRENSREDQIINANENLNKERVGYDANGDELFSDCNPECLEATRSSDSDKESTNGDEEITDGLTANGGVIAAGQGMKDQRQGSFSNSERQIYEMQLAQLQEQLVNAMIDNQDMGTQLKKLKAVDVGKLQKELQEERDKNHELKEKLKQKQKAFNSKLQRKNASRVNHRHGHSMVPDSSEKGGDDWVHLCTEEDLNSQPSGPHDSSESAVVEGTLHSHEESAYDVPGGADHVDSVGQAEQTEHTTSSLADEPHRVQKVKTKLELWKMQLVHLLVDRLWDFVNDELETDGEEDSEGEPLAVKRLKENINRFSIKPITSFIKSVDGVLSWSNPTASFLIFLVYLMTGMRAYTEIVHHQYTKWYKGNGKTPKDVYMYSVWHGFFLPLILFVAIWKLFMNYLHAKGIAKQLGFIEKEKDEGNSSEDYSWSDKFQLVLQVARKVQNTLGKMADSLEKVKNLLSWHHPVAARKLFTSLCMALLASLLLKGPTLFRLIGLFLGIKLFIVNPIYHRFPKVKRRYDSSAKLWRELPTDVELAERPEEVDGEVLPQASSLCSLSSSPSNGSSSEASPGLISNPFSEKFKLPSSESALPGWEDGKRCAFMDKERPLSHIKHGRLFLSQSYLCFEKARSSSGKHISIRLDTIARFRKAKPIGIMPGTGMALEVQVHGVDKPYIFGGIIGRDDVYDNIRATGRAGNMAWALV